MNISENTEKRILKAMEKGAQLVFHLVHVGTWNDGFTYVSKITLERNGNALRLTNIWRDESESWTDGKGNRHYVSAPDRWCDEDGLHFRRLSDAFQNHLPHDLAARLTQREDTREEYAGYRGDYDSRWCEVWVHASIPVPCWVTEQWDTPVSRYGLQWP